MPGSSEQDARVAAGKCACGCGNDLPRIRTWRGETVTPGARWHAPACRQRGYRHRLNEGAVRSKNTRQRELNARKALRLLDEAAQHDQSAKWMEDNAKCERAAAAAKRATAAQLVATDS